MAAPARTKDRKADAKAEDAAKAKAKRDAEKAKAKKDAEKAKAKREAEKAEKAKREAEKANAKREAEKAKAKREAEKAKAKKDAEKAKAKRDAEKAKAKRDAEKAKAERDAEKAKAKKDADKAKAGKSSPPVQAVEEVAVAERGETTDVATHEDAPAPDGAAVRDDAAPSVPQAPENDKTVRPHGWVAEQLGKQDAVTRSTQRPTLSASFTTRDHDVIRAWALSRGGRPADVEGTGDDGGAGVLRIEFVDGPGDDSRLEDVDWSAFFTTFDRSDVDFLYQERVRTGAVSRFHKIVRAGD